ncbi:hypothetical protein UY3_00467 [Chelonia mydas]|uniref:Uncharacterized protein n=1 Tax=Chelonia mydas TaxID=8469 RepID=M7C2D2_CHEMY|nr:hypothetical protein UY3_00467 [Chelonia mydas]
MLALCSRGVTGASEAPLASFSRPQRKESVGRTSLAPCLESNQVVDPLVLTSSPHLEEAIAALPPSILQEDFRGHQELLEDGSKPPPPGKGDGGALRLSV